MSVALGVELLLALGCLRWVWKRCTYAGSYDSATWPIATAEEFEPVPRICRLILAVYEPDLSRPGYTPAGGFRLNPNWIVKRVTYEETLGNAPPYMIYVDHDNREIVMAIRGMNLRKESDYKLMLDNRLGEQMFDGGYVHYGLLKSATWVLNAESETLCRLWEDNGREYKMVFAGHSLGSGVAALLSVIVVNHTSELGGIPRSLLRCYAMAPARCMSLNLAVKYADIIYSIVLQDDFLPRTPTPLQDIFKSIFCLPCFLVLVCLRDTFVPEGRKLKDPTRLYAPGRMYHIVERKSCRCGRYPPEVRTAIPVDGRFEHIVLSCHAISDHGIRWIEREGEKAVQRLKELDAETTTVPPMVQRLERKQILEKEHKDALKKAITLKIPHAVMPADEESLGTTEAGSSSRGKSVGSGAESLPKGKSVESGVESSPQGRIVGSVAESSSRGKSVEPSQDETEQPSEGRIVGSVAESSSRGKSVEPSQDETEQPSKKEMGSVAESSSRGKSVEPSQDETEQPSEKEKPQERIVGSVAESSSRGKNVEPSQDETEQAPKKEKPDRKNGKIDWNEMVEKLFSKDEPAKRVSKTGVTVCENSSGSLGKQLLKKDDSVAGNDS